jgi:hypothetical protein
LSTGPFSIRIDNENFFHGIPYACAHSQMTASDRRTCCGERAIVLPRYAILFIIDLFHRLM